jgi:hypothetical protein
MGSLPGIPDSAADPTTGFNDPRGAEATQDAFKGIPKYGPYPGDRKSGHEVGEPDTNRLALGQTSEEHQSLINRRAERLRGDPELVEDGEAAEEVVLIEATGIPTATKPYLSNVSDEAEQETRGYWEEPHPKGIEELADPYISGIYPYNHVFESESGHITEVDDSPGAERMLRQHMAGTFEEIHPDGTMVTKIVGSNYEIVIGSENIVIKGSQNITVEGSVRELIKGDYIQEIEGNFYQKIHKNHRIKVGAQQDAEGNPVGGNREEEIVGNHAFNINDDVNGRIGGDVVINSEKSKWEIIGGQYSMSVEAKTMDSNPTGAGIFITSADDYMLSVNTDLSQSTISGIMSLKSGDTLNMKSAKAMTIQTEADGLTIYSEGLVTETFKDSHTSVVTGTLDLDVSVEVDVDSALINLN